MKVTVAVVTARPGGLDVLRAGLAHQEFDHNDFELVLVDALYDYRKDLVTDYFSEKGLICRHIPPKERIFPTDAVPQARNTAIAKARGELILWLVDYSFLQKGSLREHWGTFEFFEKKRAGMAAHRYLFPPKTAYELPGYAPCRAFVPNQMKGVTYDYDPEHAHRFVKDLEAGFYDSYMLSVFEKPIENEADVNILHEDLHFYHADPKRTGLVGGKVSGNYIHFKGEGTSVEILRDCNGFDEGYTSHLYDDSDFGYRLEAAGQEWILLDQSAVVDIVNPRHLFPHLVRLASTETHLEKYKEVQANPKEHIVAPNKYSLKDASLVSSWWY